MVLGGAALCQGTPLRHPGLYLKPVTVITVYVHPTPRRLLRIVHHTYPSPELGPEAQCFQSPLRKLIRYSIERFFHVQKHEHTLPIRFLLVRVQYASASRIAIVASAMKVSGTNPFWHSETNSCTTSLILFAKMRVNIL
jgi:hypothetical protein